MILSHAYESKKKAKTKMNKKKNTLVRIVAAAVLMLGILTTFVSCETTGNSGMKSKPFLSIKNR